MVVLALLLVQTLVVLPALVETIPPPPKSSLQRLPAVTFELCLERFQDGTDCSFTVYGTKSIGHRTNGGLIFFHINPRVNEDTNLGSDL